MEVFVCVSQVALEQPVYAKDVAEAKKAAAAAAARGKR